MCRELNSIEAVSRAKLNMEKYYPVVGVLEEFNTTLTVLEKKLPIFFGDAMRVFNKVKGKQHAYLTTVKLKQMTCKSILFRQE